MNTVWPVAWQEKILNKTPEWANQGLLLVFFPILLLFAGCEHPGRLLEEGNTYVQAGQMDLGLERLQRAYSLKPDDPDIQASLGKVLSLEPITMSSAMYLMEKSLKEKPDRELRGELFLFYLDARRMDRAREMLSPDHVPLEEFFSAEMVLYRKALHCILKPSARAVQELANLDEDPFRNYFLGRCLYKGRSNTGWPDRLQKSLEEMKESQEKCRLLVYISKQEAIRGTSQDNSGDSNQASPSLIGKLDEKSEVCSLKYPGDIQIRRRLTAKIISDNNKDSGLMFDPDFKLPPYPDQDKAYFGGEDEKPGRPVY